MKRRLALDRLTIAGPSTKLEAVPALHRSQNRSWIVLCVFALISVRPIVDLFGSLEQASVINPGGVWGLLVAALCIVFFLGSRARRSLLAIVVATCVAGLVVVASVQLLTNGAPEIASLARFIVGFSPLALLVSSSREQRRSWRRPVVIAVWVTAAVSLVPAAIAVLQATGQLPFSYFDYVDGNRVGRPSGGYLQPNSLARLMVFNVLLVVLLSWSGRAYLRLVMPLIALFVLTAVLTTHRTSLVALVVVGLVLSTRMLLSRRHTIKANALVAASVAPLLILAAAFSFTASAPDRVLLIASSTTAVITEGFTTLSGQSLEDGSFLRGRGRNWSEAIGVYRKSGIYGILFGLGFEPLEAHNDVLRILLMHGAVGVMMYAVLFTVLFIWVWRSVSASGRIGLIATNAFLVIYAIPLHPTAYPYFMWLFFLSNILALVLFERSPSSPQRARAP